MGIPFTVILGIGWRAALAVLFRGMLGRNRDAILPTAAFWIGLLAIPHSQVVFPLQMPGFALPVCSILAWVWLSRFQLDQRLAYSPDKS